MRGRWRVGARGLRERSGQEGEARPRTAASRAPTLCLKEIEIAAGAGLRHMVRIEPGVAAV
ncbi:MAG TPA: hypothetical protein VGD36_12070, partial [Xanthobacteraceae bacterium]